MTSDNTQLSILKSPSSNVIVHEHASRSILQLAATDEGTAASIASYLVASLAKNTIRAYQGDIADFVKWGGAFPADETMIASYISARAQIHSVFTIARRLSSIGKAHINRGLPNPATNGLVRSMLKGVRRTKRLAQARAKPLSLSDVAQMLTYVKGLAGARDRAIILLGFAGGFRRSELVGLNCEDVSVVKEGLLIILKSSKTDQDGVGRLVAVPFGRTALCPVLAYLSWLSQSGIGSGAVFRPVDKAGHLSEHRLTPQSVNLALKRYARKAGFDAERCSGHSLRAGLVTSAAAAGVPMHKIMEKTGHRSLQMVFRYIREGNLFAQNASSLLL